MIKAFGIFGLLLLAGCTVEPGLVDPVAQRLAFLSQQCHYGDPYACAAYGTDYYENQQYLFENGLIVGEIGIGGLIIGNGFRHRHITDVNRFSRGGFVHGGHGGRHR